MARPRFTTRRAGCRVSGTPTTDIRITAALARIKRCEVKMIDYDKLAEDEAQRLFMKIFAKGFVAGGVTVFIFVVLLVGVIFCVSYFMR